MTRSWIITMSVCKKGFGVTANVPPIVMSLLATVPKHDTHAWAYEEAIPTENLERRRLALNGVTLQLN